VAGMMGVRPVVDDTVGGHRRARRGHLQDRRRRRDGGRQEWKVAQREGTTGVAVKRNGKVSPSPPPCTARHVALPSRPQARTEVRWRNNLEWAPARAARRD